MCVLYSQNLQKQPSKINFLNREARAQRAGPGSAFDNSAERAPTYFFLHGNHFNFVTHAFLSPEFDICQQFLTYVCIGINGDCLLKG